MMVIIYMSNNGCLVTDKDHHSHRITHEMAECLIKQYRHPALGWREDTGTVQDRLHIFFKEEA